MFTLSKIVLVLLISLATLSSDVEIEYIKTQKNFDDKTTTKQLAQNNKKAVPKPEQSPINPDYIKWLADQSKRDREPLPENVGILIPHTAPKEINKPSSMRGKEELPSRFSLVNLDTIKPRAAEGLDKTADLTPIKNQGACGVCWAFAAYGALEGQLKSLNIDDGTYDFSEDHLKHNNGTDSSNADACSGGNIERVMAYLARYNSNQTNFPGGPVLETQDPYDASASSTTCGSNCAPARYVDNINIMPVRSSTSDNTYIKNVITAGYPIYTSMLVGSGTAGETGDSTWDAGTNSFYTTSSSINHAVVIIGWDDAYAAQGQTGAWIVRNSWGAGWGDSGYFYVPYTDRSIAFSNVAYFDDKAESSLTIDKIYSYDPLSWGSAFGYASGSGGFMYAANKFTISGGDQRIDAIGVTTYYSSTSYEIKIYDTKSGSSFTSQLGTTQTGTLTYGGYHTISLTNPVSIADGEDFIVSVKFSSPNGQYVAPFEAPYSGTSAATANAGESFYSYDGSTWSDLTSYKANANFTIKAIASYGDSKRLSYSKSLLEEDAANDGSVDSDSITITLSGSDVTFANNNDPFVLNTEYTVSGLPAGFTAVSIDRVSDTELTLTVTGSATNHELANSINNLGITFLDAAFDFTDGSSASDVVNYNKSDIGISFMDAPALSYSTDTFRESTTDDGSIDNSIPITITLTGDTFADPLPALTTNIAAVGQGLTVSATRLSATSVSVVLSGNANPHTSNENTSTLSFEFSDGSFTNTADETQVTNYQKNDLKILFDPPYLTYSTTTFEESSSDNGAIDNTITITINNDTFTGNDGDNFISSKLGITNLPSGLTASAIKTSATTLDVTLSGSATAHDNTNDVRNLTFTFKDGAFTTTASAADVKSYSVPSIEINFSGEGSSSQNNESGGTTANSGATPAQLGGQNSAPSAVLNTQISVSSSFSNPNLKTVRLSGGWSVDTWFEIYYRGALVAVTEPGVREIAIDVSAYNQSRAVDGFTVCAVNNFGSSCNASPLLTPWGIVYLLSSLVLLSLLKTRRVS